jgi:hypothetical protein
MSSFKRSISVMRKLIYRGWAISEKSKITLQSISRIIAFQLGVSFTRLPDSLQFHLNKKKQTKKKAKKTKGGRLGGKEGHSSKGPVPLPSPTLVFSFSQLRAQLGGIINRRAEDFEKSGAVSHKLL